MDHIWIVALAVSHFLAIIAGAYLENRKTKK